MLRARLGLLVPDGSRNAAVALGGDSDAFVMGHLFSPGAAGGNPAATRPLCRVVWINSDTGGEKSSHQNIHSPPPSSGWGPIRPQHLSQTDATSLDMEGGDYSGLELMRSDRAANYSCDYKRSGWLIK